MLFAACRRASAFGERMPFKKVRQLSEAAVHQTSEVIVRQLFWRVIREQLLQLDPQHLDEVFEFKIQNELQARLDFGNAAPGNIPARALQFCSEL